MYCNAWSGLAIEILSNMCIVAKRINTVYESGSSLVFFTPTVGGGDGHLPPEILAEIDPPPSKKG